MNKVEVVSYRKEKNGKEQAEIVIFIDGIKDLLFVGTESKPSMAVVNHALKILVQDFEDNLQPYSVTWLDESEYTPIGEQE
jgi:hypothetical protein